MTRLRWALGLLFAAAALGCGALGGVRAAVARPMPTGIAGPEASALAARVAAAVDVDAWDRTGAVTFEIFGHAYLWDRQRNLVRYEDGRGVVLTEGWRPMGRAFDADGQQVGGDWKDKRVQVAYESFINDSFWVFGPDKVLRDSVTVGRVALDDGGEGLLTTYGGAGGVTPGDSYLWEIGADGKPVAWRMWTQVLPVPGARVQWTDWVKLDTGAWVASRRQTWLGGLSVSDLRGAATLEELFPGDDPFAPMMGP